MKRKNLKRLAALVLSVGLALSCLSGITVQAAIAEIPDAEASAFRLDEVTLNGTDTVFAQNMRCELDYLRTADIDALLYNFYVTFGQTPPSNRYVGGWESPSCELRGHYTGHFMSALALAYASTGDEIYKERLDNMVSQLRALQLLSGGNAADYEVYSSSDPAVWGTGYLGAYAPDLLVRADLMDDELGGGWAPYYTLHKLIAGFVDSYTYTGNEEALETAKGLADWCYDRLSVVDPEKFDRMWQYGSSGENGGMQDVILQIYQITGEEKYLVTAGFFEEPSLQDPLAAGTDTVRGRHCNTTVPQVTGMLRKYLLTGESFYYDAAKTFWDITTDRYIYSIGGIGVSEHFQGSPDALAQNIRRQGNTNGANCETCAAYNMLKLTKELSRTDPDNAAYMDYFERTLVNQIAASIGRNDSYARTGYLPVTYMLPLQPGAQKVFDSYGGFSCCHGSGMENHVKYQDGVYSKTEDTLYVHLYLPTTVTWAEKELTVTQETTFPSENSVLTVSGSGTANMKLRVPYWATEGFEVKVNGEVVCTAPEPSSYVTVENVKDGDRIEVHMPYTIHLDKTPDKLSGREVFSLMYGPMVMVLLEDSLQWQSVTMPEHLEDEIEVLRYNTGEDGNRDSLMLKWGDMEFVPIFDVRDEAYHAYLKIKDNNIVIDQEHLELSAGADASYCSGWETIEAVNDGIVSETSLGSNVKHFGTWGNDNATEEWVSYYWDEPVWIDTTEIFFFDNSNGGDGGVLVPSSYRFEYLDLYGAWQPVLEPEGLGVEQDQFNKTTFLPVQTMGLRVTMVKEGRGVGIIEWKVSGEKRAIIDWKYLETAAIADCSYCSPWETLAAVNDGMTGSASVGTDCKHWGTWGNDNATEEWVSYTWLNPMLIYQSEMYFFDNSNGGDGGVQVPSSYKYEYLDAEGNWQPFTVQYGMGILQDQYNVTIFEPVVTTSVRVTLQKKVRGVGINEWRIYGALATQSEEARTDAQQPTEKLPYQDVAEADWFYDAVYYNYLEALMIGLDASHFAPHDTLSRAQFATVLYRIAGEPKVSAENPFRDIAEDEWYTDAVLWAYENNIVSGYGNGLFGAADRLTREQMTAMLYRYADYLQRDVSRKAAYDTFADAAAVSGFAQEAMRWAVGSGIITGKGSHIDPQGGTTRAECAAMIERFHMDRE